MEKLIAKLIRILDGEEGPEYQGDYAEDARYTYPERIALAREVVIEMENLLTRQSSRPDNAEAQLQTFSGVTCEATNTNNQQSGG